MLGLALSVAIVLFGKSLAAFAIVLTFRYLEGLQIGRAVMGERELALGMAHYALLALGRTDDEADAAVGSLREAARAPA